MTQAERDYEEGFRFGDWVQDNWDSLTNDYVVWKEMTLEEEVRWRKELETDTPTYQEFVSWCRDQWED